MRLGMAAGLALAVAAPGWAQDRNTNARANPQREAGEATLLSIDNSSVSVTGQINVGLLTADDGEGVDSYVVDNANSTSRVNVVAQSKFENGVAVGFDVEIGVGVNSSGAVAQLQDPSEDLLSRRVAEVFLKHPTLGDIRAGWGYTPSDGTVETDIATTGIAGYSSVDDAGSALSFRDGDGDLADVTVGAAFNNLDGLGRGRRVRYDTPTVAGVTVGASVGENGARDVAVSLDRTAGDFDIAGTVGWAMDGEDDPIMSGSVSTRHTPSGIVLTFAASKAELGDDARDASLRYVKVGWGRDDLIELGRTALSVDYARNDDVARDGDEGRAYGLQAVQTIEAVGVETYVGLRRFELDRPGASLRDVDVLLIGGRWTF